MSNGQKNQLRGYLLGQLPEREQEALETQFFVDGAALDEVWAAENQLVDDYVRERLSRTERQRFEQYYLDSQPHRDRVALARQLLKVIDNPAAKANEPAHSSLRWANFWAFFSGPQLSWGLAAVMLLATFLVGTKLLRERAQPTAQVTPSPNQELAQQHPAAQTPEDPAKEKTAPNAAPPPSNTPQPPPPKVFAFVLSAGLLRGSGAPQPLTIPPGTGQVELRMRLETNDYARYQIKLRSVEGAEILSRSQLKPRANQLAVLVPANKLRAGDYILALSGVQADTLEEVNRYFFRVTRK